MFVLLFYLFYTLLFPLSSGSLFLFLCSSLYLTVTADLWQNLLYTIRALRTFHAWVKRMKKSFSNSILLREISAPCRQVTKKCKIFERDILKWKIQWSQLPREVLQQRSPSPHTRNPNLVERRNTCRGAVQANMRISTTGTCIVWIKIANAIIRLQTHRGHKIKALSCFRFYFVSEGCFIASCCHGKVHFLLAFSLWSCDFSILLSFSIVLSFVGLLLLLVVALCLLCVIL